MIEILKTLQKAYFYRKDYLIMKREEILIDLTNLKDLLYSLSAIDPDNIQAVASLPNSLKIVASECENILTALINEE